MRRESWILVAILCEFPASAIAAGIPFATSLPADESQVVESEAWCVESSGIPIGDVLDSQARYACLRSPTVQRECGMDGQQARLQAFRQWEGALMKFQAQCEREGGAFAFITPDFAEPKDESFCTLAEPEVHFGPFENPLCNFVSRCPPVPVICRFEEENQPSSGAKTAMLPGIPVPVRMVH
jgi:hypothetical protein